uniref:Odorant receptor Or3l n=1 Tax=Cephus cinctus TaxID=211228 RepID=S5U375_CEPCN|nr:odorant receptor Or3l [Cephus cinctus]
MEQTISVYWWKLAPRTTYFRFSIWMSFFTLNISLLYVDLYEVFGNLEQMLLNLSDSVIKSLILAKLLLFRFSEPLARLITDAQEDITAGEFGSLEEKKCFLEYYQRGKIFYQITMSCVVFAVHVYFFKGLETYLFSEVAGTTVILGLTCYNIIANSGDLADISTLCCFALYASSMILLLYGYCFVGECLIHESTKIHEACAQCTWYSMPLIYQKALIMCMLCAQRPLQLTAAKFYVFSLDSFSNVIKTSIAYVSMLRTVV